MNAQKLYADLMFGYHHFGDYAGFVKWLNAIPDDTLRELVVSVEQTEIPTPLLDRPTMDGIIRKKLMSLITGFIRCKANETKKPTVGYPPFFVPSQFTIDNMSQDERDRLYQDLENHEQRLTEHHNTLLYKKLQNIYDMYSLYVPMLNLYRREHDGCKTSFEISLQSQLKVCDRLEKEMGDDDQEIKHQEIKLKIRAIFQNIREYTDQYRTEMIEYNRQRRNLLLLKMGMNRDVFRYIVPFLSNDPPPLPPSHS